MNMLKARIGVVVGRFQCVELTPGHRYLLDFVSRLCDHLCILVGTRDANATSRDPMDFETRKLLLQAAYPHATILAIPDHPSDERWSEQLDHILHKEFDCGEGVISRCEITLYGARDSFLPYYSGIYRAQIVPTYGNGDICATTARKDAAQTARDSADFRAGAIYALAHQMPTSYQVVDVAIINRDRDEILLGQKTCDDGKWRFIGGFVDPADPSLERAATREIHEEVGMIEVDELRYIGSTRINDARYRNQPDQIMSAVFIASYIFGAPKAADDMDLAKWFPLSELPELIESHQPILELVKRRLTPRVPDVAYFSLN